MDQQQTTQTLIVGAGPAGLAVAACLRKAGQNFVIIEQTHTVGTRWRNHYDRLHLHTARDYSTLPHFKFAKGVPRYPSRQQVVQYLEAYASEFALEPEFGTALTHLSRSADRWLAETPQGVFETKQVVICTGYNRIAKLPDFAPPSDNVGVMHSQHYRNHSSIPGPRNLVVGAGNSGAEIALDLAESGRRVDLAVRGPLNVVPKEVFGLPLSTVTRFSRFLPGALAEKLSQRSMRRLYGDLPKYGLMPLPYGVQCQVDQHQRVPLIDVGTIKAIRQGQITVRPGVQSMKGADCTFTDGTFEHYDGVVLATGFRPRLDQLLPHHRSLLNAAGSPKTSGAELAPGLFFCGFRISTRGMLNQIGREATTIAERVAASQEVNCAAAGNPKS